LRAPQRDPEIVEVRLPLAAEARPGAHVVMEPERRAGVDDEPPGGLGDVVFVEPCLHAGCVPALDLARFGTHAVIDGPALIDAAGELQLKRGGCVGRRWEALRRLGPLNGLH
jgi:hypothetical protein